MSARAPPGPTLNLILAVSDTAAMPPGSAALLLHKGNLETET